MSMNSYLLFQIYAPLVSWGTQAVGQERPTVDHPGRSALLGLLAAALGIKRKNEEQQQMLSVAVKFGVKLYATGLILRDFHTVQAPPENKKNHHLYTRRDELKMPKLGTILSFRSYLQDSLCIVAIRSNGEQFSVAKLLQAINMPHYHLYFGRKSCPPAIPLNPAIIDSETLKQALDSYTLAEELQNLVSLKQPRYFWEKMSNAGLTESYTVPRYDQPTSRKRWQFAARDEYVSLGER